MVRKEADMDKEHDQFSKFFGVMGAIIGFFYGATISDGEGGAAIIGAIICGVMGVVIGSVVYRVIMVGLIILGILIRHQIFAAVGKLFE
jgi:hypothetical protein